MTDPTQTPISPTDQTAPPQAPASDFFGGSEEVFDRKDVFHNPDEKKIENGEIESGDTKTEGAVVETKTQEPAFDVSIPPFEGEEPVKSEEGKTNNEGVEEIVKKEPEIKPEVKPEVKPQSKPIVEREGIKIPAPQEAKVEAPKTPAGSDIVRKFDELFQMTKKIYEMRKTTEGFNLLGADNDKIRVVYKFFLGDEDYPLVSITKMETNKEDEEETTHELSFYLSEQGTSLNVNLDEALLFDEEVDFQDDLKKKMQVTDKINKFIFLLSEEARKLEKEIREKEAEEQEKRKLQDIFRNF